MNDESLSRTIGDETGWRIAFDVEFSREPCMCCRRDLRMGSTRIGYLRIALGRADFSHHRTAPTRRSRALSAGVHLSRAAIEQVAWSRLSICLTDKKSKSKKKINYPSCA